MKVIIQRCVECDSNYLQRLPDPWGDTAECIECGHPNDIIKPIEYKELSKTEFVVKQLRWSDYLIFALIVLIALVYCLTPLIDIIYYKLR